MLRAVLDSNILVSSFIRPAGPPGELRRRSRAGEFELCTSRALAEELRRVTTRPSFLKSSRVRIEEVETFLNLIPISTRFAEEILVQPVIVADPDDDVVLATAVATQANYIVTGDQHLLELVRYRNVLILTPRQFLDEHLTEASPP